MKFLVGKIPFTINPSFWILSILIGWYYGYDAASFFSFMVVVFVSVFVHEMGHALLALSWGQRVQIILGPLGGLTLYHGTPLSRRKEFLVVFCGPLFGLLLSGLSYLILRYIPLTLFTGHFFQFMLWANIFWSILNLMPVHPLDGGKLMAILLEGLFGLQGMRLSYLFSGIFAILLTAFFILLNNLIGGALFLLCAFESFQSLRKQRYFRTTASEQQVEELEQAEADWQRSQPEKAIERLVALIKKANDGELRERAVELLAGYLVATSQTEKAYTLLATQAKKLTGQTLKLYQLVCYKLALWQQALEAGTKAFREFQDAPTAIMNAFASAHLHDISGAINWLSTVKRSKSIDMQPIVDSADFDTIRNDAAFQKFVASCK